MSVYIARVSVCYDYAQEHLSDLGDFWNGLKAVLHEKCSANLLIYRFTFASYSVEAGSKAEAKKLVKEGCDQFFGNSDTVSEIIVAGFEHGDEKNELIRSIFNNYYGVSDYHRLIAELADTIPILIKRDGRKVLIQQNYLFAVDNGSGFSTLLPSLGDFLHRMEVYPEDQFEARTDYIEYKVGKETKDGYVEPDDIITYLYDTTDNSLNIMGLDITYYLEGRKLTELRDFVRRLDKYQDRFIFAFRIPFLEKRAFDEIKDTLSDLCLLRTVQVPPLHDTVIMEAVWNEINETGYTPLTSITDMILDRIHLEKTDGRFYGFKTAKKIADEIVIRKSVSEDAKGFDPGKEGAEDDAETDIRPEDIEGLVDVSKQKATGYAALEELIGMEDITARIREMIAQVKVSIRNEKLDRPCIHMRFTGAPGTGKTTVARIIGQIMREEGILRKGGFFEYSGRDLVAEYVGQTAVKTATICRDSYGSVLFIDEAYSLYEDGPHSNDYGKEALTTLVSEMENHRDDMLVVMAGYTDEMDTLMKANPGLRSRMPQLLHFPSYTKEQLFEIFMLMVRKHFPYTEELEAEAKKYFLDLSDEYIESREFANARFVRNLYERTWSKAALRVSLAGRTDITLQKEDFIAASGDKEFSEKIERKKKIGF